MPKLPAVFSEEVEQKFERLRYSSSQIVAAVGSAGRISRITTRWRLSYVTCGKRSQTFPATR